MLIKWASWVHPFYAVGDHPFIMTGEGEIAELLANTSLLIQPGDLILVSIDKAEEEKVMAVVDTLEAFSSVTFDHAEVSLVLSSDDWDRLKGGFEGFEEEGPYRLITFDTVLDLSIVGFMAVVSARLAEAGVSIYALSTFLRDHILVKAEDVDKAVDALTDLIEESRRKTQRGR